MSQKQRTSSGSLPLMSFAAVCKLWITKEKNYGGKQRELSSKLSCPWVMWYRILPAGCCCTALATPLWPIRCSWSSVAASKQSTVTLQVKQKSENTIKYVASISKWTAFSGEDQESCQSHAIPDGICSYLSLMLRKCKNNMTRVFLFVQSSNSIKGWKDE